MKNILFSWTYNIRTTLGLALINRGRDNLDNGGGRR
jgi:hypothetical protein